MLHRESWDWFGFCGVSDPQPPWLGSRGSSRLTGWPMANPAIISFQTAAFVHICKRPASALTITRSISKYPTRNGLLQRTGMER